MRKLENKSTAHVSPIRKPDHSWARNAKEKTKTFANHLVAVFQPRPSEATAEQDDEITILLEASFQISLSKSMTSKI